MLYAGRMSLVYHAVPEGRLSMPTPKPKASASPVYLRNQSGRRNSMTRTQTNKMRRGKKRKGEKSTVVKKQHALPLNFVRDDRAQEAAAP